MNEFLNPYIAGAPVVEPSMFFGRQDVFDWIEQNLSGRFVNHILVIHGQRRVGKTSVLKQIPNHLPSHFIHVFFDLQGRTHTSLDRFQWWLAREICRSVNQVRGQTISLPEREQFSQDGEFLVATFMPEVLSRLGESVLLLTFDEFDTLSEPEIQESLARPLITYLRRLFDLPSLTFIFSIGSSGHKLENMQASYTEFFKTALYRKISFLKHEDCSQLITRPVEGVLEYEAGAVERIYEITSGHPYFTQLICHELFSLSQKTGRRAIVKGDVDAVLEDVIERGTVNLKFVWDEANDLEKWLLSCLAHELQAQAADWRTSGMHGRPICNDQQLLTALHDQHVRCSGHDINTALVHLREKDVLTQDNHFIVELLSIWLLKNRPLERVREELIQVNPIANRYNEIGDEFRELGQLDKAMDSYKQALATDPSNLRAQVSMANLHLEGKDYLQAVEGFEAALRLDDDDVTARSGVCTALLALGEEAGEAGKPDEAIGFYQRVLSANPDHPEAHQRLALLYAQQAEEALAAEDAELALRNYAQALEHAPDDDKLASRYALAKEKHTKRLIDELIGQSEQALAKQEWNVSLDAIQRALLLAPDDPVLLVRLSAVMDAPRLAQIASLSTHGIEMEQLERWEEAVQDWEACLQLKPEHAEIIQQSLEHACLKQKIAATYSQAHQAIKEGKYTHAIALLQGVIAQDASYKDAAELLVTCLKVRPKRKITLKLPSLPKLSKRNLLLAIPAFFILVIIVLSIIVRPQKPVATPPAGSGPSGSLTSGEGTPLPTMGAASQDLATFTGAVQKIALGKAADQQLDFASHVLPGNWNSDLGIKKGIVQDGVLQMDNQFPLGKDALNYVNYMLLVVLRFDNLGEKDSFVYSLRQTSDAYRYNSTEYSLRLSPSTGEWTLDEVTEFGGQASHIQKGKIDQIGEGLWFKLGVIVQDDTLWMYWEDKLILTQNLKLFGYGNNFRLVPETSGQATLSIDDLMLWDIGTPEWMRHDWLTSDTSTVWADHFAEREGWQFSSIENSKFDNGKVILHSEGGDTFFSRDDLQGKNIAMQVTFSPIYAMPDSASLLWTMAHNKSTGDMFGFAYFPGSGFWEISKQESQEVSRLLSGWAPITPQGTTAEITVVVNEGRVSAFYQNTLLGSVLSDLPAAGKVNVLSLRNVEGSVAEIDIRKIGFWSLDPFVMVKTSLIGDKAPDVQDDFSGAPLKDYWQSVSPENTLQDGALRVNNWIGQPLHLMNYILQVDVRFDNLASKEVFVYAIRSTPISNEFATEYQFSMTPSTGDWYLFSYIDPQTQRQQIMSGQLAKIEPGNWYELGVVLQETTMQMFWDGEEIFSLDNMVLYSLNNHFGLAENPSGEATLEIDNWRSWDLGCVLWQRNDWIRESTLTFGADYFEQGQGWGFYPTENEKYQDGRAILFTDGGETFLSSDDLQAKNFALDVTFIPGAFPDPASLVWTIGKNINGDRLDFEYFPVYGKWQINKVEDQQVSILVSGLAQPVAKYTKVSLMILVDGDRVSAFQGDIFLGYAEIDRSKAGTLNTLSVRSNVDLYTQVDILMLGFWDLDTPEMMTPERINLRTPSVEEDDFKPGEGWEFNPPENEKIENGNVILFTGGGDTYLSKEGIKGTDVAIEVTFIPRMMPDTASLMWQMGKKDGSWLGFEYQPITGKWRIFSQEKPQEEIIEEELASGAGEPTPQDSQGMIMVVADTNHIGAFLNGSILGGVILDRSGAGTNNNLAIKSYDSDFAQVDIVKISAWDLGSPEWMRNDWITTRVPKFMMDKFQHNEGWEFTPDGTGNFENERLVLSTSGGETSTSRNEFSATNFAIEVTFIPKEIPLKAYLWLSQEGGTGDRFALEYSLFSGNWSIFKSENQAWSKIITGQAKTTMEGTLGKIMLVVNQNRVSAFYSDTFLGSIEGDLPASSSEIRIAIQNNGSEYSRVDIAKIRFWNLDEAEWMSRNWITLRPQTFSVDTFKSGEGWQFGPQANEKYQDNYLVLYTNGGETELTRNEMRGTDGALYVAFIPRIIADNSNLVWFIRENSDAGSLFSFEFTPLTGAWVLFKIENNVVAKLISGNAQAASVNEIMEMMVVWEGNRVSAFQGNTFLGSVESGLENAGTMNWLILRSPLDTYAQVDLAKCVYWSLDR